MRGEMKETQLAKLRNIIGETSTKLKHDNAIRTLAFVFGGRESLEPYLGTAFVGCASRDAFSALYDLTRALRRFGCPLLMKKGESMTSDNFPAGFWVTFACRKKRAETLANTVSAMKGCDLQMVSSGIYTLRVESLFDAILISGKINHLNRTLRIE